VTAVSPTYSRRDFARFFREKYRVLLRAALDPAQRRPRYRDPAVIEAIAAGYRALTAAPEGATSPIARHVFMLWQQGWDAAPPLVQACARSWRERNPGWTIHMLDDASFEAFAPTWRQFRPPASGRPARSNIQRLSFLRAHGGVWADATLFCARPLDEWLPAAAPAGLFMFDHPRPYRDIDLWFIATESESPVIAAWHEMVRLYWDSFRHAHHYYWMEYLFELLQARQPVVAATWRQVPKLSALGPLAVQGNPFDRNAPRAIFDLIAENRVPVHKLSHKWLYRGALAGTPVGALTGLDRL
jgi:hypothetical protein